MKESTLAKIALTSSIIGTIALFILSQQVPPELSQDSEAGDIVIVSGTVTGLEVSEKVTRFEVDGTPVVIFNSLATVQEGMLVEVEAELEEYMGRKELLAFRIRRL